MQARVDAVPLRVVMELEADRVGGTPVRRAAPVSLARAAAVETTLTKTGRVRCARQSRGLMSRSTSRGLSANGYVTPHAPRSRLAEEFRVIKRPLLNNINGKVSGDRAQCQSHHGDEFDAGRGQDLRVTQPGDEPGDGTRHRSAARRCGCHASRVARAPRRLPPSKGLLDLLVEPALSPGSVVLRTNVENLSVLPAGSPQESRQPSCWPATA